MNRERNDRFCMDIAHRVSKQSYAIKSKVGAVMVRGDNILAVGYNGTPAGWDNVCEANSAKCKTIEELVTKPEVLHAESNMIAKMAKSTQTSEGSTVYVTLSPCLDCAKQMYQAGVVRLVYAEDYRDLSGIEFLIKAGVIVEKLND